MRYRRRLDDSQILYIGIKILKTFSGINSVDGLVRQMTFLKKYTAKPCTFEE
uniref:Uncharacterized protein n=1 Tax=Physcomitrium patens TaxID=3218 RepID=A0A2K1ISM7_PHYPA|nr:hypothetical protein PHYPA_026400 [Physcomitrium patens]